MANTRDRVTGAVTDIRPYVERALTDEKVRQDVQSALSSARSVFNELVGGRGVTYVAGRVASDKEIQENLRGAIDDLRRAADRVQGKDTPAQQGAQGKETPTQTGQEKGNAQQGAQGQGPTQPSTTGRASLASISSPSPAVTSSTVRHSLSSTTAY